MTQHLDDIKPDRDNYLGARRALVASMTRAFRAGADKTAVWRSVAPAFSRDQVKQYLGAVELHDAARKALGEAGLDSSVGVWVTGIDAPREARLSISADPEETPDFGSLPERIRGALRDFHITVNLLDVVDADPTPAMVDACLKDGDTMRLVKSKPRT